MNPPNEAVTFLYIVRAQPGKEDDLAELLRSLVTKSRYEPGNIIYETYEVTNRFSFYMVYSVWLSQQVLDAHHATALFAMRSCGSVTSPRESSGTVHTCSESSAPRPSVVSHK
jgi:quinol monooxygenase YgiN